MPHDYERNKLVHLLALNDQNAAAATEILAHGQNKILLSAAKEVLQGALRMKIIIEARIAELSSGD